MRTTILVLIAIAAILTGLSFFINAPNIAKGKLERSGYTDIQMTGKRFISLCTKDHLAEGFTARLDGRERSGYVCTSPIYSYIMD